MHAHNNGATVLLLIVLGAYFLAPPAGAQTSLRAVHEAPLLVGGNQYQTRGLVQGTLDGNELTLFAAFWLLERPWAEIDVYQGDPLDGGEVITNLGIVVPTLLPYGGGVWATLTLTGDQVAALNDGLLYLVVHTYDPDYMLSGRIQTPSAEVEMLETPLSHLLGSRFLARGRVRAIVTQDGLRVVGFVNHLSSNWQRVAVYRGAPGEDGEEVGMFFNYSNIPGLSDGFSQTLPLYEGWEDDLAAGLLYVEVHTGTASHDLRGRLLHPANQAPAASTITSPEQGSYIVIGGETEPVDPDVYLGQVEFTRVDEPDGDPVGYLWQASLTENFEGPTLTIDLGVDTTRTHMTVEFAATIFDSLTVGENGGVLLNTPTNVYHRIVTTDGSLYTNGDVRYVTVVRGRITSVDAPAETPDGFALHGNYPNPFNPSTTVVFDLPAAGAVTLEVFDLMGRRVWAAPETVLPSGANQRIEIDGSALASGAYLYRLTAVTAAGSVLGAGRMMLVK